MPSGCLPWFCIATKYGQQFLAEAALAENGWHPYFPLHLNRRTRQIEPLFPGYGFTAIDLDDPHWPRIYRTYGVYTVLGWNRRPAPLPVGVIEDLQARTSARRVVDDPGQTPGASYMAVGAAGSVLEGPLAGFSGVCTRSRRDRLTMLLSLFGRQVETEFHPRQVEAV